VPDLLTAFIFLGAVALAAPPLVIALKRRARWYTLKRAKAVPIASLPQGERAMITGVIAARGDLLTSVLGEQPCIGYSATVETALGDKPWQSVVNAADCGSFYVTDESGTAVVEGPIVLARSPGAAWEVPPASAWPVTVGETVRSQEMLLRPGDRVSVLGRATMELDPAGRGSYREPPMLPHMRGSDKDPVIVANADELQVF
jgi:hypothetical protein